MIREALSELPQRQAIQEVAQRKTASIYATSMAPTWWYKIFSGPLNIPDSYGISVLKNAVLNHCGIKTKRVCILGEVGHDVNTASMWGTASPKGSSRSEETLILHLSLLDIVLGKRLYS